MLIPLRISLKGFLSYREEQEVHFDGASLWVLAGPNGAGKSAVFDAITYGIFGCCRGMAQNLTELINHHCDALQVEIDFVVNGVVYRVRRTLNRQGSATRGAWCLLPSEDGGTPYVEAISNTDMERGFDDWVEQIVGTFETFTSSVLLQQGESEKLLRAMPKERYTILAEIIDLAPYQTLFEKVDRRRAEAKKEVSSLEQQLRTAPVMSDEDVSKAAEATNRAKTNHDTAQRKVEQLIQLLEQARTWEQLQADLTTNRTAFSAAEQLLERADEIEAGYARWRDLDGVVPILRRITRDRRRHAEKLEEITGLGAKLTDLSTELSDLDEVKKLAEAEESKLLTEQNAAHKASSALSGQLAALAPLLAHGTRFDEVTQALDKAERDLMRFPETLPTDIESTEEELAHLTAAQSAYSWLQALYERRSALAEADAQERTASGRLSKLRNEAGQKESEHEVLQGNISSIRASERMLHNAVASAQDRYDQAVEKLADFSSAAEQPLCDLCGQEITEEHANRERERLATRIEQSRVALEKAQEDHTAVVLQLQEIEEQSRKLSGEIKEHNDLIDREERQQHRAQTERQVCLTDLKRTFDQLSEQYQVQVAVGRPSNAADWLGTSYPLEDDLIEIGEMASKKEGCASRVKVLLKQQSDWQRSIQRRDDAQVDIDRLMAIHSYEEVEQAQEAHRALSERHAALQDRIAKCEHDYKQATKVASQHRQAYRELSERLQSRKDTLLSAEATKKEVEKNLRDARESLPAHWQEHADFSKAELDVWEAEHIESTRYKVEATALSEARHSLDGLSKVIKSLESRIVSLPQEAQRPATDIDVELEIARQGRDAAHTTLQIAREVEGTSKQQYAHRLELLHLYQSAQRELHLCTKLSQYMGRDGIQHYLLRAAEQSIVALANEVLGGLSRGKMHLAPRTPKANGRNKSKSGLQRGQALDLVVHDQRTGNEPMPVALASGSQRFRIAVSLALAIGRYVGHGSSHMSSVIIDEGFGSLDKMGRDDMIQQLNDLQQEVSRVILVSHEDEFAGAFANGYAIELVDGSSNVRLLESS